MKNKQTNKEHGKQEKEKDVNVRVIVRLDISV